MILQVGDVDLNVLDEGSGPPLVLLHGHTLDLRVWDECVGDLLAAGFRVVRYDQRGHGRSGSPAQGYRWGDHAADLAAVVSSRDAAPAHLVGMSKGGGIAIELTLRRPELVASLSLVGAMVPDFQLSDELMASFRELARGIRREGVARAVEALWLTHPLVASAAALPAARARLEAMLRTFPAGEYLAVVRDDPERSWNVPDRLGEIRVPTLVVRGEWEIADFVAMSAAVAERVPGARRVTVASSGHIVALEQPRALTRELLGFLAACGEGGAVTARPASWQDLAP